MIIVQLNVKLSVKVYSYIDHNFFIMKYLRYLLKAFMSDFMDLCQPKLRPIQKVQTIADPGGNAKIFIK